MSRHQPLIVDQELVQESNQDKTDINNPDVSANVPLRPVSSGDAIPFQPIRLAKVVAAKFARRD